MQSREHRSSGTATHACSQDKTNVPSLSTSPCANAIVRISLTEDTRTPLLKASFAVLLANRLMMPPVEPCEHWCPCEGLCIPVGTETPSSASAAFRVRYLARAFVS